MVIHAVFLRALFPFLRSYRMFPPGGGGGAGGALPWCLLCALCVSYGAFGGGCCAGGWVLYVVAVAGFSSAMFPACCLYRNDRALIVDHCSFPARLLLLSLVPD